MRVLTPDDVGGHLLDLSARRDRAVDPSVAPMAAWCRGRLRPHAAPRLLDAVRAAPIEGVAPRRDGRGPAAPGWPRARAACAGLGARAARRRSRLSPGAAAPRGCRRRAAGRGHRDDELREARAQRPRRRASPSTSRPAGCSRYRARICTVQLAWDAASTSPWSTRWPRRVRELAALLGAGGPMKIVHDVAFDARLLAEVGVELGNVHDTASRRGCWGAAATGPRVAARVRAGRAHRQGHAAVTTGASGRSTSDAVVPGGDVAHLAALDDSSGARSRARAASSRRCSRRRAIGWPRPWQSVRSPDVEPAVHAGEGGRAARGARTARCCASSPSCARARPAAGRAPLPRRVDRRAARDGARAAAHDRRRWRASGGSRATSPRPRAFAEEVARGRRRAGRHPAPGGARALRAAAAARGRRASAPGARDAPSRVAPRGSQAARRRRAGRPAGALRQGRGRGRAGGPTSCSACAGIGAFRVDRDGEAIVARAARGGGRAVSELLVVAGEASGDRAAAAVSSSSRASARVRARRRGAARRGRRARRRHARVDGPRRRRGCRAGRARAAGVERGVAGRTRRGDRARRCS